jgi:hypothetical protein
MINTLHVVSRRYGKKTAQQKMIIDAVARGERVAYADATGTYCGKCNRLVDDCLWSCYGN